MATVTVCEKEINIPDGGGGSSVEWEQKVTEGVNIADITIGGNTTPVYAPAGGGGGDAMVIGTLTYDQSTTTYSCDKTYEDFKEVYESGIPTMLKWVVSNDQSRILHPVRFQYSAQYQEACMTCFATVDNNPVTGWTIYFAIIPATGPIGMDTKALG